MRSKKPLLIFILIMVISGCGNSDKTIENDDTSSPFFGYKEKTEKERFGEDVSYILTGDVDYEVPEDKYCNTNDDGTINMYLSSAAGTPYDVEGVIYDHDMFRMRVYVKSVGYDTLDTGGGRTTYLYNLTPIKSGETEIVTLEQYLVDDNYIGTIFKVSVDEEMRCSLDCYGFVSENENIEIYEK